MQLREYNIFFFNKFIYLFLAALGLRCCAWASSICGGPGLLFVAVHRLLIAVASLCCGAQAPGARASVVVAHELSRSAECGILPDQGSNPCPLHWQADSQPLHHQGSPKYNILNKVKRNVFSLHMSNDN